MLALQSSLDREARLFSGMLKGYDMPPIDIIIRAATESDAALRAAFETGVLF